MTSIGLQNINKTDLRGLSRNEVLRLIQVLGEWKTDDDKDTTYRTEIERLSSESGSASVNDFLIRLGYIQNPSVKKPRTKITEELTRNIINDVKSVPKMTTKEIADKNGVPVSTVDAIKKTHHLTNPRKKAEPAPTETTPTESVDPTNVTQMVPSPELQKEVA